MGEIGRVQAKVKSLDWTVNAAPGEAYIVKINGIESNPFGVVRKGAQTRKITLNNHAFTCIP